MHAQRKKESRVFRTLQSEKENGVGKKIKVEGVGIHHSKINLGGLTGKSSELGANFQSGAKGGSRGERFGKMPCTPPRRGKLRPNGIFCWREKVKGKGENLMNTKKGGKERLR